MAKALTLWKRTRNKGTPVWVGNFFQHLAARVLHARLATEGTADLEIEALAAGIEVKGADNNHHVRISLDQFENHTTGVGTFPHRLDHFLYCLGCYHNREPWGKKGNKRRSLLARCRDEVTAYQLLARQTTALYIFDHQIFTLIRKLCGVRRGAFPCTPGQEVISLSRHFLAQFNEQEGPTTLRNLGLDPPKWVVRERLVVMTIMIGLFSHPLSRRVVEVLPRALLDLLDPIARVPANPHQAARRTLRLPVTA